MSAGVNAALDGATLPGADGAALPAAVGDGAAADGDGVPPPPVEQAPASTSTDAPRASVRFNRMGSPPSCEPPRFDAGRERLG
jgi:hypothetical protein